MDNIVLENATIVMRNFSGKPNQYNPAGQRNFLVIIPQELVKPLLKDGWNVRFFKPRDEDQEPDAFLKVAVSFIYPKWAPKVVLVTSKNKTPLNEEKIFMIDSADIEKADLVIRPRDWEANGKTGIKAYLKTLYIKVRDDEFEEKYANLPGYLKEDEQPPF